MTSSDRPLATFALFAYNQEEYIREAIEGAFAQTYEPLEIILSDDCSSDRTFKIMQEMAAAYEGPHEVLVRQNELNYGIGRHFYTVLELASSDLVILAAGDDISVPERCSNSTLTLLRHPSVNFVEVDEIQFINSDDITKLQLPPSRDDVLFSLEDYLSRETPRLVGALRAVRKSAILHYGNFRPDCPTEDTPSLLRMLMLGNGAKVHGSPVYRRIHDNNLSSLKSLRKMNFEGILEQYLDDIKHARHCGFVSEESAQTLETWATTTIEGRVAALAREMTWAPYIRHLVELKAPVREKLIELARYMRKRLR